MLLLIIIASLFIIYSLLILYYWKSWRSVPVFQPADTGHHTTFSIIIPARNEEDNIGELLTALLAQTYPPALFEIIVVDDHSTDDTAHVVQQFPAVSLIQLKDEGINSYKKKAIETGIAAATGEWIITTDADCIPPPDWLSTLAAFGEEKNAVFIAAPVVFMQDQSLLQIFQTLDFMVLQGITGAAVYKKNMSMCNGANLAYQKKIFYEVGGFTGIDIIASGDDMLLMHKIATKYPNRVHYLKATTAIVSTQPMKSWKAFFNQRIRWASKARLYDDKRIVVVLLLVYLFNCSFLLLLVAGCWFPSFWAYLVILWVLKTAVELPFVSSVATFFNKRALLKYFFFFQPLHILYTIVSGLFGQFGKYEWKGRQVK
jgi:cellulose synthase/poly-beta-1,6-N-acetylglucosamine synthase-like glycosyltransferase